jgi:hypothetical protein
MIRWWIPIACLLTLCAVGCNTFTAGPRIEQAAIVPQELKPGDVAILTFRVRDRHAIVATVQAEIAEERSIQFPLRDDGVAPDAVAGDGVWTQQIIVPQQAPPGTYHVELTAITSEDVPVPVRNESGKVVPLHVSLPVVIQQ